MQDVRTEPALAGGASRERLQRGSAEAFVEALCADALAHPAVDHPYLQRLAAGEFADMPAAVRDYCHQYSFYSAEFPRYLEAVAARLGSARHRRLVLRNLEEERGHDPANPDGVPHTELFRRFARAAGVTDAYAAATPACTTVRLWRDLFLQKCASPQSGVGVGGIGIGTEVVVSTIYGYLHEAVARHTGLAPDDYLFLVLHMECDDGHGDQMKAISIELAEQPEQREALRFGVLSSLNLRSAFWDVLLARAESL